MEEQRIRKEGLRRFITFKRKQDPKKERFLGVEEPRKEKEQVARDWSNESGISIGTNDRNRFG
jgi:hypothetical protein